MSEKRYTKEYKPIIKDIDADNSELTVYTNVAIEDRDGEIIEPKEFNLENYKKNPVFLADHRYSVENIIGKCVDVGTDDKGLWQRLKYFTDYDGARGDLAKWAFYLAKKGIAAFSIGFIPHKTAIDPKTGVRKLQDVELLEVSQVAVPANQDAVLSYAKSYDGKLPEQVKELIDKAAIPYKDEGIADENTKWDAAKEVAAADVAKLKRMCAWYDSENPDVKSSYKLPHHRASDLKAIWQGVAAAMAALNGGRGGVDIPEKDRKAVYNHLVKHYKQFDKEPPDLKSIEEIEKEKRLEDIENRLKQLEEITAMLEKKAKDQIEINKRLSTNSVIAEKKVDDVWEEVINKLKGEENG